MGQLAGSIMPMSHIIQIIDKQLNHMLKQRSRLLQAHANGRLRHEAHYFIRYTLILWLPIALVLILAQVPKVVTFLIGLSRLR